MSAERGVLGFSRVVGLEMKSRPFVIRGAPRARERATAADPADPRVRPVFPAPISLRQMRHYVYELPIPLRVTDRLLQRWAHSIGDGLPSEMWEDRRGASRVSPLDDELATVIDRIVLSAPEHLQQLFKWWYKTSIPVTEIERRWGVGREEVIRRWEAALQWMEPKLIGRGV